MYKVVKIKNQVDYKKGLEIQEKAFKEVQNGDCRGVVFLLEHKPVYTIGTSAKGNNILIPEKELKEMGVSVCKTTRGGDITYHGPGQIVGYPIIDLRHHQKDVRWYVRKLEEVVINTLKDYSICASRKEGYVGVWAENMKIAAIGCRMKKWITSHGFALNVKTDMKYFDYINPCGIRDFGVDSMECHQPEISLENVQDSLILSFQEVFGIEFDMIEDMEVK